MGYMGSVLIAWVVIVCFTLGVGENQTGTSDLYGLTGGAWAMGLILFLVIGSGLITFSQGFSTDEYVSRTDITFSGTTGTSRPVYTSESQEMNKFYVLFFSALAAVAYFWTAESYDDNTAMKLIGDSFIFHGFEFLARVLATVISAIFSAVAFIWGVLSDWLN